MKYWYWQEFSRVLLRSLLSTVKMNTRASINVLMVWWSGVVVSALASINEVNLHRARLVLRRATESGFNSRCWTLISVCNQPATQGQLSLPSLRGRVPASAGKAKAGMVHSFSGWTRGVQVKLWDPLRTRAIPEHLRGVITTRCYTNQRLPLPLPLTWYDMWCCQTCSGTACHVVWLVSVEQGCLSLLLDCTYLLLT